MNRLLSVVLEAFFCQHEHELFYSDVLVSVMVHLLHQLDRSRRLKMFIEPCK